MKSKYSDTRYTVGNGNGSKAGTFVKGKIADTLHTIRYRDGGKAGTVGKCLIADTRYGFSLYGRWDRNSRFLTGVFFDGQCTVCIVRIFKQRFIGEVGGGGRHRSRRLLYLQKHLLLCQYGLLHGQHLLLHLLHLLKDILHLLFGVDVPASGILLDHIG